MASPGGSPFLSRSWRIPFKEHFPARNSSTFNLGNGSNYAMRALSREPAIFSAAINRQASQICKEFVIAVIRREVSGVA